MKNFYEDYNVEENDNEEDDTYGCDGMNKNCTCITNYDDIWWYTSCLGFCPVCTERLLENLDKLSEDDRFELLEDCENGNEEAIDRVVSMTE